MKKKESSTNSPVKALLTLAHLHGLQVDSAYTYDEETVVSGLRTLLTSFGIACGTEEEIRSSTERKLTQLLPEVCAVRPTPGAQPVLRVTVPASLKSLRWTLTEESGHKQEGEWELDPKKASKNYSLGKNAHYYEYKVPLPEHLSPGYHSLLVTGFDPNLTTEHPYKHSRKSHHTAGDLSDGFRAVAGGSAGSATIDHGGTSHDPTRTCLVARSSLVVSPQRAFIPDSVQATGRKYWGIQLRLSAVNSHRNWGIGDLTDLRELISWACTQGAGFVMLDSLESAPTEEGEQLAAISRIRLHPIYIDVEAIDDYQESDNIQRIVLTPAFQEKLAAFRKESIARTKEILAEKMRILEMLYQHFRQEHILRSTERAQSFRRFQLAGGPDLDAFGLFSAIADHYKESVRANNNGDDKSGFALWPESLKQPQSSSVREFAAKNRERIEFFQYLQWIAETQLQACGYLFFQRHAPIGICGTLPIGYTTGSADIWVAPELFAEISLTESDEDRIRSTVSQGSPVIPERLTGQSCQPFMDTLRTHMRHAGAVTIEKAFEFQTFEWSAGDRVVSEDILFS